MNEENKSNTRYQYGNVDLEEVMKNPDEYIIPACQPACKALWNKNIETYMVSNNYDTNLYVILSDLSAENKAIIDELSKSDPRYGFDKFRNGYYIEVHGRDSNSIQELYSLTQIFKMQDTVKYQTTEDFLASYKTTDGKHIIQSDGTIVLAENPKLANATLEEALKATGKERLYVLEEGRVYDSPLYLKWHQRYLDSKLNEIKSTLHEITAYKSNIDLDIATLRDTFISAEREYVNELLKLDYVKDFIAAFNTLPEQNLYKAAEKIVTDVEMGLIPEEEMEKAEQKLTLLLAAIQDKSLRKELVLTDDSNSKKR